LWWVAWLFGNVQNAAPKNHLTLIINDLRLIDAVFWTSPFGEFKGWIAIKAKALAR
jgi:hypothetical protein